MWGVVIWLILAVIAGFLSFERTRAVRRPQLAYKDTPFNQLLLKKCTLLTENYVPTFWCSQSHLSTFVANFLRSFPDIKYRREVVTLSDDGKIFLDYSDSPHESPVPASTKVPTVLVLSGLNGGSSSNYVLHLIQQLNELKIHCIAMNFRGSNDTQLHTPKSFCASDTQDLREIVEEIHRKRPNSPLIAVGSSIGSNILVKYLAEQGRENKNILIAGISISNPFDFIISTRRLHGGFGKFYNSFFTSGCKAAVRRHEKILSTRTDIDLPSIFAARNMREFDERFTCKIHNFATADDYYEACSSSKVVHEVTVPLLLVNSLDDLVADPTSIPWKQCRSNEHTVMAVTVRGGHLGFPEGLLPIGNYKTWIDRVCTQFIEVILQNQQEKQR